MPSRLIAVASLTAAVALSSCSANNRNNEPQPRKAGDTSSPPDIAPTAAPGVAFNYAYEFRLPDDRIAPSQEAHAGA